MLKTAEDSSSDLKEASKQLEDKNYTISYENESLYKTIKEKEKDYQELQKDMNKKQAD
jgi:chaperonin cofactor prefoldin